MGVLAAPFDPQRPRQQHTQLPTSPAEGTSDMSQQDLKPDDKPPSPLLAMDPNALQLVWAVSSPMLLYRLRCLFPSCEVEEAEAYKAVWDVSLRHKRTNCRADFGEHKGATFANADPAIEKDGAATQDLLDLIEMKPDDKPPSPLLAMDPNALQLVWASCTFGAKAALACTCHELRQKSQAWHWGTVPSQRWRQVTLHWWLGHKKLAHWDEQFVVQTPVSMQRQGDYEAAAKVQAAWEPGKGKWYRCNGIPDIGYDPVTGKATRFMGWDLWSMHDHPTYVLIYWAISSPMLLYRLRCLFPSCEVEEAEAYKAVWDVSLRHKRTNCRADFGEHKGAAFARADPSMEKDEAAAQDLLDLIELLCSDRCPHPYDGLVAGCVA